MAADTWAIVAATGLGPIFAVSITLWRESVRELRSRRLHVFRVLMSTRGSALSHEHVNALNLIEVDFYDCKGVITAWQSYKGHLDHGANPDTAQWGETRDSLLAKLLSEIGNVLKFGIPAIDIFKGGYAPIAWLRQENLERGALLFVKDLFDGKRSLPVSTVQTANNPLPPGEVYGAPPITRNS